MAELGGEILDPRGRGRVARAVARAPASASCSPTAASTCCTRVTSRTSQWARAQGDALIVGLNGDASVRALKGATRPFVPLADRAAVLAGLRSVDAVVEFGERTPEALLDALRPDVHVKSAQYRLEDLPERLVVQAYGGEIAFAPHVAGRSTTDLDRRDPAQIAARPCGSRSRATARANSPGWVRPLLHALYAADPALDASLFFVPDDYATGREPDVARATVSAAARRSRRAITCASRSARLARGRSRRRRRRALPRRRSDARGARAPRGWAAARRPTSFRAAATATLFERVFAVDAANAAQLGGWGVAAERIEVVGNLAIDGALDEAEGRYASATAVAGACATAAC